MPLMLDDELLTANRVAEILKVTPRGVRLWAEEGRIKFIRLPGGALRFRESEIRKILEGDEES